MIVIIAQQLINCLVLIEIVQIVLKSTPEGRMNLSDRLKLAQFLAIFSQPSLY